MKDYFQILNIPPDATKEDVRQAFRILAKQYHPDVNKSPDAHAKFCEIAEAYEFLINHWIEYAHRHRRDHNREPVFSEHVNAEVFEQFRKEAQERARRQAQMRYDKFRKQHEVFQESGINDIALLFTIMIRVFGIILLIVLIVTPIIMAIVSGWSWLISIPFLWPFALGIGWYYYDNRKNYFKPGHFYYSFDRIRHLFTDSRPSPEMCFYSAGKVADSKPYQLDLLRLKDIKLNTQGARQHNVNYINQSCAVLIPRSRKALVVHTLGSVFKLTSIISCIFFLDISSIIWRIIAGLLIGGLISRIILILAHTKSNITYLYSTGFLIRVFVWLLAISLASRFHTGPLDITHNEAIRFVMVAIILFDSFIMQLISGIMGKFASLPLFHQSPQTILRFKEGYVVYNDVPVISFFYPVFKWIFG